MANDFDEEELRLAIELSKQEEAERLKKKVKVEELQGMELVQRSSNPQQVDTIKFDPSEFGIHLHKGFKGLWESKKFSDIELVFGKARVPAHRIVLCGWSSKFESLLQSNEKELKLQCETEEQERLLNKLISFLYLGEITISTESVFGMIQLASVYEITPLKEQCGQILSSHISGTTVFSLLNLCEKYKLSRLNKECGEYLAKNFETLIKKDQLNGLSPETWKAMLNSDDIEVSSEEEIFKAVLRFAESFSEPKRRDEILNLLLPVVRFTLLSGKFLISNVEGNEKLSHLPILHQLLHETYKYKAYPSAKISLNTKWRGGMWLFQAPKNSMYHNSIQIREDGAKATMTAYSNSPSGYTTLPVFPPFDHGRKWIEYEIVTGNQSGFMIAMGSHKELKNLATSCAQYPGQMGNNLWAYESSAGYLYHGNSQIVGQAYRTGDKIGFLVDLTKGTFHIFHNRKCLPEITSFKNYASKVNSENPLQFAVAFISQQESIKIIRDSSPPSSTEVSKKKFKNNNNRGRGKGGKGLGKIGRGLQAQIVSDDELSEEEDEAQDLGLLFG